MAKTALVVGASGIVGRATAARLLAEGWVVHGLARRPAAMDGVQPVAADLLDAAGTATALAPVRPDAVYITTWLRQPTEAENIRVNAGMVRNLLDGLRAAGGGVSHVALVTGLKHYLGPFEAYGKGTLPQTPFRETQPRLDVANFYYAQEDEVYAARGARRLQLERAPPAHGDRRGGRQRHEHGQHARGLRDAVPRARPAVPLPRLGRAVERPDRHDRRAAARQAAALGHGDRGRP